MSEPAFLKRVLIWSFQVEHNGNGLMKNNSRFCQNAKFWKSQEIPGRHMSLYKVLLVLAILTPDSLRIVHLFSSVGNLENIPGTRLVRPGVSFKRFSWSTPTEQKNKACPATSYPLLSWFVQLINSHKKYFRSKFILK